VTWVEFGETEAVIDTTGNIILSCISAPIFLPAIRIFFQNPNIKLAGFFPQIRMFAHASVRLGNCYDFDF
jgi:hypothetical protein